ncbi:MAG: DegT/DnrJ/EryC1/StrS family aminotransferase [Acidobacteria bacterium]|nr:DegT/DnrJ/EryC1/StrS family aminotransferase [Acidobacteriota bacterium]
MSKLVAARPQIGIGGCRVSSRAKQLVMEVLDSNRLSAGPMIDRFEREIARLHDTRFGLFTNSGTSALQIALAALKERYGWRDGDEVLVPAVTFVATSNVVLYNNLTPVFVDIEPETFGIDPAQIERHITPRTRAIVPVHIGGHPCQMDSVLDTASRHNLRIVEDSAETMFVRYKGRPVGSMSDIGCFSTYVAHIITTGVGGLCVTSDNELIVVLKSLMNHGRDSIYTRIDDDAGKHGDALFEIADRRFSFIRFGFSYRCTEMEAALGIAQLETRDADLARRREIAGRLSSGLMPLAERLRLPQTKEGCEHAWMFYPLVLTDSTVQRAALIQFLEDRQIETRYLLPLLNQPAYVRRFGALEDQYPIARDVNRNGFYVGCHAGMTDEEVEFVVATFHAFFRGAE